jgi:beta-glucosidase
MDLLITLFGLSGYAQIGNSCTTAEELINDTERSSYIRDYLT